MLGETAELAVLLKLNDQLSGPLGRAGASLGRFEKQGASMSRGLSKIGAGFATLGKVAIVAGTAAATGIAAAVKSGIDSLNELQAVQAQTAAVLKSTGNAAHISAQGIRDQATALEDLTTIDDKTIQRSENLLLTFTNIRNQVGKNNDIFNQATRATLDMSTALGTDVKQSAIQLGKALNDPIKGITALRRVGVAFTDEQQKQIKTLVKHNDLLGAQKIILAELTKEFGGSAAAQANTFAGQQRRLADAFEDLKIALAQGVLPGLTTFTKTLADFLRRPEVVKGAHDLGTAISGMLSPANLKTAISFAKDVLPGIADGLKLAGTAAKGIFDLWSKLPKELQGIAIAALVGNKLTGGLVASGVGDLLKVTLGRVGIAAGVVNVNGGVVNGGGVPGGAKAGGLSLLGIGASVAGGIGVAALWKMIFQDPALNAQQLQVAKDARRQLAGNPSASELRTSLSGIRTGIKGIEAIPGGTFLYQGQYDFLKKLETLYAQAYKDTTLKGPPATHRTNAATEAQQHGAESRRNVNPLTAIDLKRATKEGITEGNRDLPHRRDMSTLQTTIGLGLRTVRTQLTQVESTGLRAVRSSVDIMRGAITLALGGGFGDVVSAIHGISLPAFLGTAAQQGRGTGHDGRPGVSPGVAKAGAPVGIEKNRGSRNLNVFVKSTVSTRTVDSAGATQSRYGPTPTRAGAAVVLVS